MHADSISADSPRWLRHFSYRGLCFSHFANAASQSASDLNRLDKSHVSVGLTLLRGGNVLAVLLAMPKGLPPAGRQRHARPLRQLRCGGIPAITAGQDEA